MPTRSGQREAYGGSIKLSWLPPLVAEPEGPLLARTQPVAWKGLDVSAAGNPPSERRRPELPDTRPRRSCGLAADENVFTHFGDQPLWSSTARRSHVAQYAASLWPCSLSARKVSSVTITDAITYQRYHRQPVMAWISVRRVSLHNHPGISDAGF